MANSNVAQVLQFEGRRLHAFRRPGSELIWFVLADVCEIHGIDNSRNVAARLTDEQKGVRTMDTLGGLQEMQIISEDAVYEIACTSRKPVAKRFKRWLYREVLPQVRRTGSYQGTSVPLDALIGELQPAFDLGSPAEVIPLPVQADEHVKAWRERPVEPAALFETPETPVQITTRATEEPSCRLTYHHNGVAWYVLLRSNAFGVPTMLCLTRDRGRPTKYFALVPNPDGKTQLQVCLNDPYPPIEVFKQILSTLGPGPYAPVAIATLRHWLAA